MEGHEALALSYQKSIIDRHRMEIYQNNLKFNLIIKMLEEKNILAKGEFDKRWPQYLKTDIGAVGQDGLMEGILKVSFYNEN